MNPLQIRLSSGTAAAGVLLFALAISAFAPSFASAPSLPGLPSPLPPLPDNLTLPVWFPQVWSQSLTSPQPTTPANESGETPAVIPQYLASPDATGSVASYQPQGPTITAGNAFFTSLGSNGRTCFTCHQFQAGWAMNPATAASIFVRTHGTDPLFAPVDGANCPDTAAAARTLAQKAGASSELLLKGNIRIFLPVPANAEYTVRILHDPYGCESSAKYGLPTGVISMYRRVLSSTNLTRNAQSVPSLSQQGAIMWDAREPSLESQFNDATLGHAQSSKPPSSAQVNQGVAFEDGLFTAQATDRHAGNLAAPPAFGGPINLYASSAGLKNVPDPSIPNAFNQYQGYVLSANASQASINRGETLFNTRTFTIDGVAGFNDALSGFISIGAVPVGSLPGPVTGTCSTCHNNLNVGADTVGGGRHLGIGDNSSADKSGHQAAATVLPPTSDLPLFAFDCPVGSIAFFSNPVKINGRTYDEYQTTDPGMGLISGKCADLGKFKVPRLNALAARAPYFHGGNAASLTKLVEFYDTRFTIGLSAQEKQDLVNFLESL